MYVELMLTCTAVLGLIFFYWNECISLLFKFKVSIIHYFMNFKDDGERVSFENTAGLNEILLKVLSATLGIGTKRGVVCFWIITVIPALVFYAFSCDYISSVVMSMAMIVIMVLPITLLLVKLQQIRIRSSKEGKIMLTDLLDNYKINYFNMQAAIEITAATIEEAPNSKRLLFNLSKGLNRAANSTEIKSLLNDFSFAVGTSWSAILADNIAFSLISGIRVEAALEDLIKTITLAEEVEEKAKRENNEADLILKYLAPICFLLTYIGAIRYFDLTTAEFLHYQFATSTGIGWFVIIVITYLISIVAKIYLTQTKLDL